MSKSSKLTVLFFSLLLFPGLLHAQLKEEEDSYYLFPIKPGIRNTLAGTMGELRSSHFHTGIDIRTGGQQGIPVQASADGYISRIRVSGGGYGYSLYLKHPNGKTTVYAHLKSFTKEVEKYVKEAQYKKESFEINLFPKATEFKVIRGDTIALSGNTGSSGGPHLHYDIRDENQDLLNPLTFGFNEVIDTRNPIASSFALVPFSNDTRVNGKFSRQEFKLNKQKNIYTGDTIKAIGTIGIELNAWDRMDGTRFRTGINEISVKVNEQMVHNQVIDTWSFSRARSFYQHINYESLQQSRKRYHKLYVDNGNAMKFYDNIPGYGKFSIEEGKLYKIEMVLIDSYENQSKVQFYIRGSKQTEGIEERLNSFQIIDKTLKIVGDSLTNDVAKFNLGSETHHSKNAYSTKSGAPVFLWNLRDDIPESVELSDTIIDTNILSLVPSGKEYKVFNGHSDIFFNKGSLFDSLVFSIKYKEDSTISNQIVSLGNNNIPLKGSVSIVLKPDSQVKNKDNSFVYQVYGKNSYGFIGGEWKEEHIEARIRAFGNFTILTDSIKPMIKPLIVNRDRVVFKLEDKLSGLKKIKASLNGEWILIAGDPKRKQYWTEKRNLDDNYAGDFILEVTDNANNTKIYKTKIK